MCPDYDAVVTKMRQNRDYVTAYHKHVEVFGVVVQQNRAPGSKSEYSELFYFKLLYYKLFYYEL